MAWKFNPLTGNLDYYNSLATLDARYVDVDGDTMTGGLTATRFDATSTSGIGIINNAPIKANDSTGTARVILKVLSTDVMQIGPAAGLTGGLEFLAGASTSARAVLSGDGQLSLPRAGSVGGLLIGGDSSLYRSSTSTLTTDANFRISKATPTFTVASSSGAATLAISSTSLNARTFHWITDGFSVYFKNFTDNGGEFRFRGTSNLDFFRANFGAPANSLWINASGNVGLGVDASTNGRLVLAESTSATGGITFHTDTNLYRSAANTLKTDDNFTVGNGILSVNRNVASGNITMFRFYRSDVEQNRMGLDSNNHFTIMTAAGVPNFSFDTATQKILFGSLSDANLYRSNVAALKTDGSFDAASYGVGGAAGASGTFTTADAKTVTVTNGLVTSII